RALRRAPGARPRARRAGRDRSHFARGVGRRRQPTAAARASPGRGPVSDEREVDAALEAVLLAATEPVEPAVLAQLVEIPRGYVEETGHEPTPGNPALFSTTRLFCEKLGIDTLADLPPLADFIPDAPVVEALERGLHLAPDA